MCFMSGETKIQFSSTNIVCDHLISVEFIYISLQSKFLQYKENKEQIIRFKLQLSFLNFIMLLQCAKQGNSLTKQKLKLK